MDSKILPQGERIRQLLASSTVTNTAINTLLRQKGVFVGSSDKNLSVPLLMKTIVSPDEFREIYQTQKKKEDTVKITAATIRCSRDFKVEEVFSEKLDLQKKVDEINEYQPNYQIIGDPQFYFESGVAKLEYQIERFNLLENFDNNKSFHKGSVYISKTTDGNVEIIVEENSTSRETVEINRLITNEAKKILTKNLLTNDEDFIRIRFNDFSNANRIQFFYSFTKDFCIYLSYTSTTDIDIHLDDTKESHKDIKHFLDKIDSIRLNGAELQKHILLKNNKYHGKLLVAHVSLKYTFDIDGVKGTCIIGLSFPDYVSKKVDSSELQISIQFNINKEHKKLATETQLRKKLYKFIEKNKIENYRKYKS